MPLVLNWHQVSIVGSAEVVVFMAWLTWCWAWGLQREEWQDAWLAHEAGEAQATVEEALKAPGAWEPAPSAWLTDADDPAVFGVDAGTADAASGPAWQVTSLTLSGCNARMIAAANPHW